MVDKKIEVIKDKLKKLIAKEASARDIGNQAEADAFASKIQELLLEYELEIDQVMGEARIYEIGNEFFCWQSITRPHESDWIVRLYEACSKATFCKILGLGRRTIWFDAKHNLDPKKEYLIIYGEEANRELLHYMAAQLMVKIRELARKSFKEYDGPSKRNTYIRSFYKGACLALRLRLLNDQRTQANEYGIVLRKDIKVQEYFKNWAADNHIRVTTQKTNTGSSADGWKNGIKAGESVGINKGVNGNYQAPKLLG